MLEKPSIPDESILSRLREDFNLPAASLEFLPLGADVNTAVYRAETAEGRAWFVKLRSGVFDPTAVTLPRFLSDEGIAEIIPPLAARDGRLWVEIDGYKVILYPFIEGRDGYTLPLAPAQWHAFGAALRRVHDAALSPELERALRREDFSPRFRQEVRMYLEQAGRQTFRDPVAIQTAALLRAQQGAIEELLTRTERYAAVVQSRPFELVPCHTDLHAGNLLITPGGAFYIVDWDQPLLAPRERDLMYVGGGQGFLNATPEQEEAWFYPGYGPIQPQAVTLAYYRCERIVQDIAAYGEQLLASEEGGADRPQSYAYLASNFRPGGVIDMAYRKT